MGLYTLTTARMQSTHAHSPLVCGSHLMCRCRIRPAVPARLVDAPMYIHKPECMRLHIHIHTPACLQPCTFISVYICRIRPAAHAEHVSERLDSEAGLLEHGKY